MAIYPPLALCPPSPAVTPGPSTQYFYFPIAFIHFYPGRKRKLDTGSQPLQDAGVFAQQLQTCTEQNKVVQNKIIALGITSVLFHFANTNLFIRNRIKKYSPTMFAAR